MIDSLVKFSIEIPVVVGDLTKAIDGLQAKKKDFLDRQVETTKENERRAEEKIEALKAKMNVADEVEEKLN